MIKSGDTLLGLYFVDGEPVQSGSTSKVWKVRHKEWGIYLALKQPKEEYLSDKEGREDFISECDMWIKLGLYPHIVPCYYIREIDDELWIFSEWCDGGNLSENIKNQSIYSGAVDEQQKCVESIALQAMLGIRYAHRNGVVHKDIKPANIMLTADGVVRITDFGSASAHKETFSMQFCSPEQIAVSVESDVSPSNNITAKTDIFSWALTVIAMYCGDILWADGKEASDNIDEILSEVKLEIPQDFRKLLLRCLETEPEMRPDADEIIGKMLELFKDNLENDVALSYIDLDYPEETPDSLNNRALSYFDLKEYDKADKCWERALQIKPSHVESRYNKSVFLWKRGKLYCDGLNDIVGKLNTPLKKELLNEVHRCTKLKVLLEHDYFRNLDEPYGRIDCIQFSKDNKKILAVSKEENFRRILEIKTGDILLDIPFDEEIPKKTEAEFCQPITFLPEKNLVLEENIERDLAAIKEKDTGCIYSFLPELFNFPSAYSFSPNGAMICVGVEFNGLYVYSLPEIDTPKLLLCRIESPEKVIERKREYERLKGEFIDCLNEKNYRRAVDIVNEIGSVSVNDNELRYMKKLLFPVCKRRGCELQLLDTINYGTTDISISDDDKYFLTQEYDSDYEAVDCSVTVWSIGQKAIAVDKVFLPDVFIETFWFDEDGKLRFNHNEFDDDYRRIEYISVYDINTKETVTTKVAAYRIEVITDENGYPLNKEVVDFVFDEQAFLDEKNKPRKPKTSVPSRVAFFCEKSRYKSYLLNSDKTILIAGNDDEVSLFYIDNKIQFDAEKARQFSGKIVYNFEGENRSADEIESAQTEDLEDFYFSGIDDRNRFLIKLGGKAVSDNLIYLNASYAEAPLLVFKRRANEASKWLENKENEFRQHPDKNVQYLLDISNDDYDRLQMEVQRQNELWHKDESISYFALYLRSLKEGKSQKPFVAAKKRKISGFDEYNSFLLKDDDIFRKFQAIDRIMIKNPSIKFAEQVSEAQDWQKKHSGEPHKNPEIQHLIDVTDEEFEQIVRENARQSSFWHGADEESFLQLFLRTQSDEENKNAGAVAENAKLFGAFPHSSAAEKRRINQITKLTNEIRNLRNKLLENVVGQDHVVHAFCEGIFNSEVLLEADTERVRPRAVFTFAGPPGVGKTYLAEQAAKYLGRPFKRFDMTEYSAHESHLGLIGFESTWKNSCPGQLTTFVSENPNCVLLFDEIEKAHQQVIQVFYQMLDLGVVTDKYYSTKSESEEFTRKTLKKSRVSFRDTIIIFTTNAGRSLYEGDCADNCAGVSTKTLLNALKTEVNPLTDAPFFPSAIVSRIATGYPLLFNNLKPYHLVLLIEKEFARVRSLFQKQYGITIDADKETMLSLLYSEGGVVDARALRARVELFFKNEFFKIFSSEVNGLSTVVKYKFSANTANLPDKVSRLFRRNNTPEVLVYSGKKFAQSCKKNLSDFVFHTTQNIDEAIEIAGENDIDFAIIDIAQHSFDSDKDEASREATMLSSFAASGWRDGKTLFNMMRSRLPELPIYLLESSTPLSEELVSAFVRAGARGKLAAPSASGYREFGAYLNEIFTQIYMQGVAADIAAEHKVLYFETAPKIRKGKLIVELRNFELRQAPDADDADDLLSEAEKPKERFSDVIGAESAKKELSFFVNFLKNPKKFAAQGHRMPKGVLLYGRPGTGKTMLAKAMAGESDVTFIPTAASTFVNKYAGSGSAAVRELFKKARRYAPSIVFIDEVDAIGKQRTGSESSRAEEETLNALLTEMDGFATDNKRPVFVLAATNYGVDETDGIGVLDEAFMRRFDRRIKIELPDTEERKQFLNIMLAKIPVHNVTESMIDSIASRSIGISPAILENIIETAKRIAFDEQKPLDDAILEEAYELTKHGDKKEWGEEYLLRTAQHECGHALISILGGNTPAYLTVEARGDHGGYMEFSEKTRSAPSKTKAELIWEIRTALGGRAAEIACYGKDGGLSTGAYGDLESATNRVRNLIIGYGMDEEFGLATMTPNEAERSPELRARVNKILSEQLEISVKLISENREKLDKLCELLLLKNRLTGEEIDELFAKLDMIDVK